MSVPGAALVLAAGLGTRMRPLTLTRPKALLAVGGVPLVDRAITHARNAGLAPVVVNVHHHAAQMRRHLCAADVVLSDETDALRDTGGGVRHALPLLGAAPFVVLNVDAIWQDPSPLADLLAAWDGARMDGLLQLVPRDRARAHGGPGDIARDPQGQPRFRGDAPTAPYVYTGAQILTPAAFDDTPTGAFPMVRVWRRLLARGRLGTVVHHGLWVDAGTPAGLEVAEAVLSHG